MNDINQRVAFAFEGFRDKILKDDPKFVKWIFRVYGRENGVEYEELLPYHRCKEEDYAAFWPISKSNKALYTSIREDEDRDFLCMDWNDKKPFLIFGDV